MTARDTIIDIIRENSPMRGHGTNAELMADLILGTLHMVRAEELDAAAQEAPETLGGADQWAWLRARAVGLRHRPECTCTLTDPKTWTYQGSAVEPGSQMERDPDCPRHSMESKTTIMRGVLTRTAADIIGRFVPTTDWEPISVADDGGLVDLVNHFGASASVATSMEVQRHTLGELIWKTSRADESTISVTGANIVAEAILARFDLFHKVPQAAEEERTDP